MGESLTRVKGGKVLSMVTSLSEAGNSEHIPSLGRFGLNLQPRQERFLEGHGDSSGTPGFGY